VGDYRPYKFWDREQLFSHVEAQCNYYKCEDLIPLFREIIYSNDWNPIHDYNGCNVIQDKHHPFPPCLLHDFRWIVDGGGLWTDIEFRNVLQRFEVTKVQANKMFIGVRIGWLFYFKWSKMWKNYKNR